MLFQVLLQALNTLHSQQGKWETQRLQLLWDRKLLKLGVWQRHTGLKNWSLAAAPFAIQLLSKLLCQLWDKQKLDSRLQMPQNREEQQAKRREIDWCWHMLTSIEQTISNTRPRSIHASNSAFTCHVHGRHSCAIDILTNGCNPSQVDIRLF